MPATAADWLDPAFGAAGFVTAPSVTLSYNLNTDVGIRADGNVVAIGSVSGDFAVLCYDTDGNLETSFSGDGMATTDFNGAADYARAVAVDGSKTVVVGTAQKGGNGPNKSYTNFALARYNADGSLDTTFGSGGKVQTSVGNVYVDVVDVAIANGKIVVLGGASGQGTVVLRYNANGTLDSTFGSSGKVVLTSTSLAASSLAIQTDEKIVIARSELSTGFVATRLNANGSLDGSFGSGGSVTTFIVAADGSAQTSATARGVAIQADGKIVLAGHGLLQTIVPEEGARGENIFLVRYNDNGTLDTSFGGDGMVTADWVNQNGSVNQVAYALALQGDGKIVTAGVVQFSGAAWTPAPDANTLLARFNTDGSLDETFGAGGRLEIGIGADGDAARAIALQSDGKLVVAGISGSTNVSSGSGPLTVSRILSDGPQLAVPPTLVMSLQSPVTAGLPFNVTVTFRDDNGNTITDYTGTVHFASSDPQAVLPADYLFTPGDLGTHTFQVTFKTAGNQSLTVTAPDAARVRPSINVQAGAAHHLVISGPTSVKANKAFSITVTAYDAYGNVATGYTGTVHFSSSDSGATLPANYTFTASDAGVHTFTGLKLNKKGTQSITIVEVAGIPPLLDIDDVLTITVT